MTERVFRCSRPGMNRHRVVADCLARNRVLHELHDAALRHVYRTARFLDLDSRAFSRDVDRIVCTDFRDAVDLPACRNVHRRAFRYHKSARDCAVVHVHRRTRQVEIVRHPALIQVQRAARRRKHAQRTRSIDLSPGHQCRIRLRSRLDVDDAVVDRRPRNDCASHHVKMVAPVITVAVHRVLRGPAAVHREISAADKRRRPCHLCPGVHFNADIAGVQHVPARNASVVNLQVAVVAEQVLVRHSVLVNRHHSVVNRQTDDRVRDEVGVTAIGDVHRTSVFRGVRGRAAFLDVQDVSCFDDQAGGSNSCGNGDGSHGCGLLA